ncbi:MAG: glycogen synthase GlgA [Lachnospiraceae bacterium]|nr:glycogen synthase GlgA [Lachnospiraceae bacterium]
MKKVLFVSSECVPFIKTGGLADVAGELPKYINKENYDVRVIIPNYKAIPEKFKKNFEYKTHFYMDLGWRKQYVGILETELNGVKFYLVDNEYYFNGDRPYGNMHEDIEKFAYFSRAVVSLLPYLEDFRPDLVHCNDWQTGLIPVFIKDFARGCDYYEGIKTIMTIHNLKFQGIWDIKVIQDVTGLGDEYFTSDKLEAYGSSNFLKGGLVYADYINTVSETYAEEIKMPFYGEGLDGLMRHRADTLCGIVNGIDYSEYNPATDKYILHHFTAEDFRKVKAKNKKELQKELGLEVDEKKFMIGLVSRLTDQKGLDLVECVMEEICDEDVQFVILGTGDPKYENLFRHYEHKYPENVSASIYYNNERAHRIYASCDAFLMPSLFEPCGLSQLMSMRYGTVPIVRETGGLKDTVEHYMPEEGTGTGFRFMNYNAHEMLDMIRYAKHTYYGRKREWNKIVERAMAKDFSWECSVKKYEELYDKVLGIAVPVVEEVVEETVAEEEAAE